MEETFHVFGVAALQRDYNVIIYEGPGHRALVNQGIGSTSEWEKAVPPIVDYVFAHKEKDFSFIDTSKIGLVGMSLGGYLAARAAAFEPRLAAVMCVDGVYDFLEAAFKIFPEGKDAWDRGDAKEFDRVFETGREEWSTNRRWFHDDLKYTFCKESAYEAFKICEAMSLGGGVAEKIGMPAFVGDAADDMFFEGQSGRVVEGIGENATLKRFGADQGAQLHCQSGWGVGVFG